MKILLDTFGQVFDDSNESYNADNITTLVRNTVRRYATTNVDIAYIDEIAVMLEKLAEGPETEDHCYSEMLRPFLCGLVASNALPAQTLYHLDWVIANRLELESHQAFFTANRKNSDEDTSVYCQCSRYVDKEIEDDSDDVPF